MRYREEAVSYTHLIQTLVFVPTIRMANELHKKLCLLFRCKAFTSQSEDKEKIVDDFHKKKYECLITTTILERGITIKGIYIIILQADHVVFNEASLTPVSYTHLNKKRDIISYFICILTVFLVSLPILAFVILSFVKQYPIDMSFSLANIKEAFQLGVGMYLKNSLAIALVTSLVGICVIYFTAYILSLIHIYKTFGTDVSD